MFVYIYMYTHIQFGGRFEVYGAIAILGLPDRHVGK